MKRLLQPIVLPLILASGTASGQMDDPLIDGIKPLISVWSSCVSDKASGFSKSAQSAGVAARSAMFECRNERDKVYRALFHEKPSRSAELMNSLDSDLQNRTVKMLSDGKLK